MKLLKKALLIVVMASLIFSLPVGSALAKDYKMTVVAGHPPIFLWVTLCRDFFIPEVDKRLLEAGGKHKIVWNQAYGGTVAKIGGALEAIEEGIAERPQVAEHLIFLKEKEMIKELYRREVESKIAI